MILQSRSFAPMSIVFFVALGRQFQCTVTVVESVTIKKRTPFHRQWTVYRLDHLRGTLFMEHP